MGNEVSLQKLAQKRETYDSIYSKLEQNYTLSTRSRFDLVSEIFTNYSVTETCVLSEMMEPRVCFVSLYSLFDSWRDIPIQILFSSLLIFVKPKCHFSQLGSAIQSMDLSTHNSRRSHRRRRHQKPQLKDSIPSHNTSVIIDKMLTDKDFISLLRRKKEQGRFLWVSNNPKPIAIMDETTPATVDKRWQRVCEWLQSHIDPITAVNYCGLRLKHQFWIDKYMKQMALLLFHSNGDKQWSINDHFTQIEYCDEEMRIRSELISMQWDLKPICEILNQSNHTLIPLMRWDEKRWNLKRKLINCVFKPVLSPISHSYSVSEISDISDMNKGVCPSLDVCIANIEKNRNRNEFDLLRCHFSIQSSDGTVYII